MPRHYSAFLLLVIAAGDAVAAAPPPAPCDLPAGTVSRGRLWTVTRRASGAVEVHIRPLDGKAPAVSWWTTVGSHIDAPRWHFAHSAVWLLTCDKPSSIIPLPRLAYMEFRRLDAADALANKDRDRVDNEEFLRQTEVDCHFNDFPAMDYRRAGKFCEFDAYAHAAFVPLGPGSALHFALTNVKTPPKVARGGGSVVVGYTAPNGDAVTKPYWHFSVHAKTAKWDHKAKKWNDGGKGWQKEETLAVAFREPFRAFADGKDYYFLTDSGSLFRSPPAAAKGKPRPVARVYDGRERPVSGVITDADAGRTFFFVPPAKPGGRPAFFAPAQKPKLEEYDPKDVPAPKLDEPHRTIMHHALTLVARKKIEVKPAADAKK